MKYGYDAAGRLATVHAEGYGFLYDYLPHSTTDRVKTVTAPFVKQIEFTYERGRDSIASVANRVGFHLDTSLSEFTYTQNADGQRVEKMVTYGAAEAPSLREGYEYDPDTGGVTDVGVELLDLDLSAPEAYAYAYDKIGNRLSASVDDETTVYQANALNQYSSIDGRSASYDADGNLTAKDGRTYRWDAENRLIAIHDHDTIVARYTYDHQSRRIARETPAGVDERYLYDGWNLIAIYLAGESQPAETYTRGKDLSGSLQGAGGVGGLLFANTRNQGNDAWIYHYDANGNVTEVTSPHGRQLDRYVYDAFGNLVDEALLTENRYRFSTKAWDDESGFCYYGYRYYWPWHGRWLSRDPIEEEGGANLYGFVGNNPLTEVDVIGLEEYSKFLVKVVDEGVHVCRNAAEDWTEVFDGARVQASTEILDDLKDAISNGQASAGSLQYSPEFLSKVANLADPGDSVYFPDSAINGAIFGLASLQGALDLYAYINWVTGVENTKFNDFHAALVAFDETEHVFDCHAVCNKGADYISAVPAGTVSDILRYWWQNDCATECTYNF